MNFLEKCGTKTSSLVEWSDLLATCEAWEEDKAMLHGGEQHITAPMAAWILNVLGKMILTF